MGDSVKSVKSLTEVQVDNFPLIHQVCDFIIEAYQGSQAWLLRGESMLTTTPDYILFHVPGNGHQNWQ